MIEVVILAGGKGTRLKSVVYDRPKPMAEINGAPFLCHLMDYWVGQGAKHFVLSVGFMKEFVMLPYRNFAPPSNRFWDTGFRCAKSS